MPEPTFNVPPGTGDHRAERRIKTDNGPEHRFIPIVLGDGHDVESDSGVIGPDLRVGATERRGRRRGPKPRRAVQRERLAFLEGVEIGECGGIERQTALEPVSTANESGSA